MKHTLTLLPGEYAVWKLPPAAAAPDLPGDEFWSMTRTATELSVVSRTRHVVPDAPVEAGWSCLGVAGPLAFEMTGVLSALAAPLAAVGVSIFAVSTYDTDYLLVHTADLDVARAALRAAGHDVRD